ncbi:CC0125/CC1285 family lipoprotein [Acinetobacter baumannii]|uniref:CC0125/CC1285 family lipoprotein n=1 Tax=Acinetobacter baumannii TaxID=470 RepID=UPI003CC7A3FB
MNKIFLSVLLLSLSGCAVLIPPAYNPGAFMSHFREGQASTDSFYVSYKGDRGSSPEQARDFVVLRGAELVMQNDFRYFKIPKMNQGTLVTSNYQIASGVRNDTFQPMVEAQIVGVKEPGTDTEVLDAIKVAKALRIKYRLNYKLTPLELKYSH